jgi:hypothetical protein
MRITTVRELRDRATTLLRSPEPILVTRRGRVAGVFLPWQDASLPIDMKRELFSMLTTAISAQLKKKRVSEKDVLRDFQDWQKVRRETRRRR